MSMYSPMEDFSRRSLVRVQGTLARLRYLAGLKHKDGCYHHWGLARSYGNEAADQTGRTAHEEAFFRVLETPLQELQVELSRAQLNMLLAGRNDLVPGHVSHACRRHFNSILDALQALAAAESLDFANLPSA